MTARLRVGTCMIDQTKREKVRFTPVSTFSISIDSDKATVDGISEKVAHEAFGSPSFFSTDRIYGIWTLAAQGVSYFILFITLTYLCV